MQTLSAAIGSKHFAARFAYLLALCAVGIGLLLSPAFAQVPGNLGFRKLGNADALPLGVTSLLQDKRKSLWIGTQDGLFRHDGDRITPFLHEAGNAQSMPDNWVQHLAQTRDGVIWVASQSQRLSRIDPASLKLVQVPILLPGGLIAANDSVTGMLALQDGRLLLSTRLQGLRLLDSQRREFLPITLGQGLHVKPLLQTPEGLIWYAEGQRVMTVDAELVAPRVWTEFSEPIRIVQLRRDAAKQVWIASADRGLLLFDAQAQLVANYSSIEADPRRRISDQALTQLMVDSQDRVWVGSARGLDVISRAAGTVESLRHFEHDQSSLPANQISALLEDESGLVWVGSWAGGLAFHDLRAEWLGLIKKRHSADSDASDASALTLDAQNSLWTGSLNVGLTRYRAADQAASRDSSVSLSRDSSAVPLSRDSSAVPLSRDLNFGVSALAPAGSGGVWVGTVNDGLFYGNPNSSVLTADVGEKIGDSILTILESSQGALWIGTLRTGVLMRCRGCKEFQRFSSEDEGLGSLPADTVRSIFEASDGSIWLGFRNAGLAKFLPGPAPSFRSFQHRFDRLDSLSHASVNTIAEDARGRLWIGTKSGGISMLSELDQDRFLRLPSGLEQHSDTVNCLLRAADGSMWASVSGGLVRFDPETLKSVRFGQSEGVQGREFFVGSCAQRGGALYFGGLHGVTVVASDLAPALAPTLRVRLQDLKIAGAVYAGLADEVQELVLPVGKNAFSLGFSAEDFRAQRGSVFRYRLRGVDRSWIEVDQSRRFANYVQLPAGEFVFEVQARAADAEFGAPHRFKVRVLASVWQTPWAWVLYVLLGLGALSALLVPVWFSWRERGRSKESSQAHEARLRMVLENSRCELWFYDLAVRKIIRENPVGEVGDAARAAELEVDTFFSAIHPDDLAGVRSGIQLHMKSFKTGEVNRAPLQLVYRIKSSQGSYYWLRSTGMFNGSKTQPAISGTSINVNELKLKELELEKANAELNAQVEALEAARLNLAELDKRRKLALWGSGSEFFEADLQTGMLIRENQIVNLKANGKSRIDDYWPLLHPEDMEHFSAAFKAHIKGQSEFYDVIYRAQRHDDSWCWIQTRGRAVTWDEQARVRIISGTNFDVSALKDTEQALKKLAGELEHRVEERTEEVRYAMDELVRTQRQLIDSEKLAALGGLVAGVSHEINTPIGIGLTASTHLSQMAKNLSKSMQDGQLSRVGLQEFVEQAGSAAQLVEVNLRRASELIRSFKQVSVDQSSEQRRGFEVGSYLHEIIESLRPTIKRSQHQIIIECEQSIHLDSFPGALYQIISNIVLNALNHAFSGIEQGVIRLSAVRQGATLELVISDSGNGMDPETAARVFEPFFTTKRGRGGSGLGLHIVYNLVTKVLRGSIELESAPGAGARFTLCLPIDTALLDLPEPGPFPPAELGS